jgi:hypothetical protein
MRHPGNRARSGLAGRGGVRVGIWGLEALIGALAGVVVVAAGLAVTNPGPRPVPGWERVAELPQPRGEVASTAAELDGPALVVAGGYTGLRASTSVAVHAYEPRRGRWRELPDLPEARHHAAAAAIDGDVYVGGGAPSATDRTARPTLWVLRRGEGRWQALAAMPEGREGHRMRAAGGRLYVVGGRGGSSDALVYDPSRDAWSRGPALPTPRHHLGVVVRHGRLWALGGRTEDDTLVDAVHSWRPGEPRWRSEPPLPRPVSGAAEGVVDGTSHLVGGEDPAIFGGETIDVHLTLPRGADRWAQTGRTPLAVHGAAAGVLGGRLVIAGGARRHGLLSPLAWTDMAAAYAPAARAKPAPPGD